MSQEQLQNLRRFHQNALDRFEQARVAGRFDEAFNWLGTAAVVDTASDGATADSFVNVALFQLVHDTAQASENLVLKCGNVTTRHGDILDCTSSSLELLLSRLEEGTEVHNLAMLLQGHCLSLFAQLERHFDKDRQYTLTTYEEASFLAQTTRAMRQLILDSKLVPIETDMDAGKRLTLLRICLESPDYEVLGFPLRFLSNYPKAVFFIESAQNLLTEIENIQQPEVQGRAALLKQLKPLLKKAHDLTSDRNNEAKALLRQMAVMARSLTAARR